MIPRPACQVNHSRAGERVHGPRAPSGGVGGPAGPFLPYKAVHAALEARGGSARRRDAWVLARWRVLRKRPPIATAVDYRDPKRDSECFT